MMIKKNQLKVKLRSTSVYYLRREGLKVISRHKETTAVTSVLKMLLNPDRRTSVCDITLFHLSPALSELNGAQRKTQISKLKTVLILCSCGTTVFQPDLMDRMCSGPVII